MKHRQIYIYIVLLFFASCKQEMDPINLIQNTISSIDTINTISYQQAQSRGNTAQIEGIKQTERTFFYKRLKSDSITGAKTHIYFYDSTYVFLEDIYDGNKLIRKHNRDSSARVYDLIKYPDLKKKSFWGKTSPYVIQYMLKYALENKDAYLFELGEDTLVNGKNCYCLKTVLEKKALMPGFYEFAVDTNRVEAMIMFIDKLTYYPQRIRMEVYFIDNPDNVYFVDNAFYNIKFNLELNDSLFNTSEKVVEGFRLDEIEP